MYQDLPKSVKERIEEYLAGDHFREAQALYQAWLEAEPEAALPKRENSPSNAPL
ncbi:MAG TPA: hypothetical protein VJB02_04810 [Coxiellaceae bacterium]|nr:hypothetical protein [Coxiellaceae bacterium]